MDDKKIQIVSQVAELVDNRTDPVRWAVTSISLWHSKRSVTPLATVAKPARLSPRTRQSHRQKSSVMRSR